MNKHPLFSIVMVNYNQGDFIKEAIDSVISQDCEDFEFIIIDGGSTDSSVEILEEYSDCLTYWVSEEDNGQSHAFNKGFAKAKGDFFLWLNADDVLLPNSLSIAKRIIGKYPQEKWFAANMIYLKETGKVQKCARGLKWYNFIIRNGPIYVHGPTTIFHKDLFYESGGFDENLFYTMDTDLWMRFRLLGHKFIRIPHYLWTFRIHEGSKTSHTFDSPNDEFLQEEEYISKKNDTHITRKGTLKQTFFKLLLGAYFFAFFDTLRYKNRHYSDLSRHHNLFKKK